MKGAPLPGYQQQEIAPAMNNEIVGGKCTVHIQVNGAYAGKVAFYIRGANPTDALARGYSNSTSHCYTLWYNVES